MRRTVRDRVAASLRLARPHLEEWSATRLQYPAGFPYEFTEPVLSIGEVRRLRITPEARADYPPVQIEATFRAALAAHAHTPAGDSGPRRLDVDVQLLAKGAVRPDGSYQIAPKSATVKAWWRGREPWP